MTASGWRAIAAGLALALVASLIALIVVARSQVTADATKADRALALVQAQNGAEKAARADAIHLTTYDYKSLDADFAWVDAAGTAKFRKEYASVSAPIRKFVAQLMVHAEGSVDNAAATAQNVDHVTVLLFVDQTLTSGASKERKLVTPRITMTMVRSGGKWLLDHLSVRNLVAA